MSAIGCIAILALEGMGVARSLLPLALAFEKKGNGRTREKDKHIEEERVGTLRNRDQTRGELPVGLDLPPNNRG